MNKVVSGCETHEFLVHLFFFLYHPTEMRILAWGIGELETFSLLWSHYHHHPYDMHGIRVQQDPFPLMQVAGGCDLNQEDHREPCSKALQPHGRVLIHSTLAITKGYATGKASGSLPSFSPSKNIMQL